VCRKGTGRGWFDGYRAEMDKRNNFSPPWHCSTVIIAVSSIVIYFRIVAEDFECSEHRRTSVCGEVVGLPVPLI
jgi:hypothetical protein